MKSKSMLKRLVIESTFSPQMGDVLRMQFSDIVDELLFLRDIVEDLSRIANRDDRLVLELLEKREAYYRKVFDKETKVNTKEKPI